MPMIIQSTTASTILRGFGYDSISGDEDKDRIIVTKTPEPIVGSGGRINIEVFEKFQGTWIMYQGLYHELESNLSQYTSKIGPYTNKKKRHTICL